jgi:predicted RNase H-like HicB family nuclease
MPPGCRYPKCPEPTMRSVSSASKLSIMKFTAAITHEPPWYVARCLEVEVASQGESVEDALENLREALELYFEDAPLPDSSEPPIIASVEIAA